MPPTSAQIDALGVTVATITEELRTRFELPEGSQGVVIVDVTEGSAAAKESLRPGDVIVEVGAGRGELAARGRRQGRPGAAGRQEVGAPADRSQRRSALRRAALRAGLRPGLLGRALLLLRGARAEGLDARLGEHEIALRDALQEQQRAQVAMLDRHRRLARDRRVGVVGDAEAGGEQHRQIIGAVADRQRLPGRDAVLRAQRSSIASLASGPTIGAITRPVRRPSATSSRLASTTSKPTSRRIRSASGMKPPDTRPVTAPRARIVRTRVRAPGIRRARSRWISSKIVSGSPASSATRASSAGPKASSPRIARRVIAATSALTPTRSASSSIVSIVMMVESRSHSSSRLLPIAGRHGAGVDRPIRRPPRARAPATSAGARPLDRQLAGLAVRQPARRGGQGAGDSRDQPLVERSRVPVVRSGRRCDPWA